MINCLAPNFSIKTTALICASSPILAFLAFIWMPESPYFLLMKENVEDAKKSLSFLRKTDITKDLDALQCDVKRQMSEKGSFKDLITIESNRKALIIMIGVRTMQQASGISAWGIFTQTVFLKSDINFSPVTITVFYYILVIIVQCSGSCQVDKYGRRTLLIISSFLCAVTLTSGGAYFYLQEKFDLSVLNWMPVAIMLIFVVFYGFGLSIIPTLMLGEMFSVSIKGKALCIMCIYYGAVAALTVKLFHFLAELGLHLPFFTFGFFCFLNVIFAYLFIIETKGKSLEDIQQALKGNEMSKL